MRDLVKKFLKEEEGSVIQYIIILAVVSAILALIFPQLKTKLQEYYTTLTSNEQKGIGS